MQSSVSSKAVTRTGVANTLFVLSGVPFFTAVLALLVVGEKIPRATIVAMTVAFLGMTLILGDALSRGTVLGIVLAVCCALCFSS